MDRLDRSLDELIEHRGKRVKEGGKARYGTGPSSRAAGGKIRSNAQQNHRMQRQAQPYREITTAPITIVRKPMVTARPAESLVITKKIEPTSIRPQEIHEPLPPVQRGSILSRLGGSHSTGVSGTAVIFSNLNPDIRASDIAELSGTIGETKRVEMQYDSSGEFKIFSLI